MICYIPSDALPCKINYRICIASKLNILLRSASPFSPHIE